MLNKPFLMFLCCCVCKATYNPRGLVSVVRRTTRSVLTASERSTAIGITTGMTGTTGGENCIHFRTSTMEMYMTWVAKYEQSIFHIPNPLCPKAQWLVNTYTSTPMTQKLRTWW